MAAGTELAKAYVQIMPSADGIEGKLKNVLNPGAEAAGSEAGGKAGSGLVGMLKKVIAGAAIGKTLSSALTAGADLQQSIGGIETLFKGSFDKVKQYADQAYKTAGLSANSYMEQVTSFSASLLQSLGGDTDKAADAANQAIVDMSDNANKMGTSMEAIQVAYQGFAKQNYTMLDNLKLGYGGTKTEMERLLAKAEELSGVKYDINNLSDVYSAIHVIQGEMEISGRTAEEAAEIYKRTGREVKEQMGTTAKEAAITFSGSLAAMKAALSNVIGNLTLGQDIMGPLAGLLDTVQTFFNNNLLPMIGNFLKGLPDFINQTLLIVIKEIDFISGSTANIVSQGAEIVSNLVSGLITRIPYLFEAGWNLIKALGSALVNTDWVKIATDMIQKIKDGLSAAAGNILGSDTNIVDTIITSISQDAFKFAGAALEMLQRLSKSLVANLPVVAQAGVGIIQQIIQSLMDNLPLLVNLVTTYIQMALDTTTTNLPIMIQTVIDVLHQLVQTVTENLPLIAQAALDIIKQLAQSLMDNLPVLADSVLTLMQNFLDNIMADLPIIIQSAIEIINQLCQTLLEMIPELIPVVMDIIMGFFDFVVDNLPVIIDAAIELMKTLMQGLIDAIPMLVPAVINIVASLLENIIDNLPKIVQGALEIILALAFGLIKAIPELLKSISEIVEAIRDGILKVNWLEIGVNIVRGLWNGLKSMVGWLKNMISGWVGDVLSFIKGLFGIHSPSKVFRDQVGVYLAKGIGVGFSDGMDSVAKDMEDSIPTSFDVSPALDYNYGILRHNSVLSDRGVDYNSIGIALANALKNVKIKHVSMLNGQIVAEEIFPLIDDMFGDKLALANRGAL